MRLAAALLALALGGLAARAAGPADADGDGILDVDDLCVNDAEDRDGFEDDDGCPDPDNDKDRIADVLDKCPNEPEIYNGFEDDDGCPDKRRVEIYTCSGGIIDRIYFRAGSTAISVYSEPILLAIADTLKGNPDIELVALQGNATADERAPLALSLDRARAVRDALVALGVAADRLTLRGYGASVPVDPAHSRAAKAKNRRVEFEIKRRRDDQK